MALLPAHCSSLLARQVADAERNAVTARGGGAGGAAAAAEEPDDVPRLADERLRPGVLYQDEEDAQTEFYATLHKHDAVGARREAEARALHLPPLSSGGGGGTSQPKTKAARSNSVRVMPMPKASSREGE